MKTSTKTQMVFRVATLSQSAWLHKLVGHTDWTWFSTPPNKDKGHVFWISASYQTKTLSVLHRDTHALPEAWDSFRDVKESFTAFHRDQNPGMLMKRFSGQRVHCVDQEQKTRLCNELEQRGLAPFSQSTLNWKEYSGICIMRDGETQFQGSGRGASATQGTHHMSTDEFLEKLRQFECAQNAEPQFPRINNYDGCLAADDDNIVVYGCAKFDLPLLRMLVEKRRVGTNRPIETVTFGSGVVLSYEQIKQIVDAASVEQDERS